MILHIQEDTICATATAPGVGGIAVVRISGPQSISITSQFFSSIGGISFDDAPIRKAIYGNFIKDGVVIDEVIAIKYKAPHSFTGEDTVEIFCHGSLYVQQMILQAYLTVGCRTAMPGEFTKRAYLNGKMDLSQAEAVADLIASESAAQHRMAMNQMKGGYSAEFDALRDRLLEFASLVELELDFSEEDVEFADRSQLSNLANEIHNKLSALIESFRLGNAIKKGIPVAIVGATNVGKSTLLNRLLGEEKAIVSSVHGTTRDVIEDVMNIDGISFRFIDTAGIRQTEDEIESLGIQRSYKKLNEALIVLWVVDAMHLNESLDQTFASQMQEIIENKSVILIVNKSDQIQQQSKSLEKYFPTEFRDLPIIAISAKRGDHIEQLKAMIRQAAALPQNSLGDIVVSNVRHYHLMLEAMQALERVREGLSDGTSGDFLSPDLRQCISLMGEITGNEITSDNILHNIFAHFCIGK